MFIQIKEKKRTSRNLASMQTALAKTVYSRDMELIKMAEEDHFFIGCKIAGCPPYLFCCGLPEIDKVMWKTAKEKMCAVLPLTAKNYHPQSLRLIVINSKNGKQRYVHLETWHDRAIQTLYTFALDPISESWTDRKSFAFRKVRSSFDPNEYIRIAFFGEGMPGWALIKDVRHCHKTISYERVLLHSPMEKKCLKIS